MSFHVIIPTRFGSTRFPGKFLKPLNGEPVIGHVYRHACESGAESVYVATDDTRIKDYIVSLGGRALMTSEHHQSGSDRIAEACDMLGFDDETIVVNCQGDEPLLAGEHMRSVALGLAECGTKMATLATPFPSDEDVTNPHLVKVVCNAQSQALYFSRAPIPFNRDGTAATSDYHLHIGLYAYRAGFLRQYTKWPACRLEKQESLEQLRALWHGEAIHVTVCDDVVAAGIDTPEDLLRAERLIQARHI